MADLRDRIVAAENALLEQRWTDYAVILHGETYTELQDALDKFLEERAAPDSRIIAMQYQVGDADVSLLIHYQELGA